MFKVICIKHVNEVQLYYYNYSKWYKKFIFENYMYNNKCIILIIAEETSELEHEEPDALIHRKISEVCWNLLNIFQL